MTAKWTAAAPKYGPTSEYGDCEMHGCGSTARTTCSQCKGEFCFGHGEHGIHSARSDAQTNEADQPRA